MLRFWTQKILGKRFYCAECCAITSHSILAREPFSLHGEIPPDIPLVCQCKVCETFFVAFSGEIYFGLQPPKEDYAKLLSRNRLVPGDWLYIDGKSRPGKVDAVYTANAEDVIMVKFDGTHPEKFTRPVLSQFDGAAPFGYKLIPVQIGISLLGDPVYHVLRKSVGVVVGTVVDGELEKRVVQLESGKILFITLPNENQKPADKILLSRLNHLILQKHPQLSQRIRVNVIHNIAYVYGYVPRFFDKEKVLDDVKRLDEFRGVIDLLKVNSEGTNVPDSDVRSQALRILESEDSPLFNYEVSVQGGALTVNAYYLPKQNLAKIKERLCKIEGLRDITLELEEAPEPPAEMVARAEKLKNSLAEKTNFSKCRYHVIPVEDGIIVEGCARNLLQKSLFSAAVVVAAKGVKVSTRLRVDNG